MHDVHVFHRVVGSNGHIVFTQKGKIVGTLRLTLPAYHAMVEMLDAYSPAETKVHLIPVPTDTDVASYAALYEARLAH